MLRDRVKCAVANPGGPIGVGSVVMLGAAPVGFRSFLAAFGAAQPAYFVLSNGTGKALGGVWTVNSDGTATITSILINDETGGTGSTTFSSACTAWNAFPAGSIGGQVVGSASARAARTVLETPLTPGGGPDSSFLAIASAVGGAMVLPAGGTWAYFVMTKVASTGTVATSINAGADPGGTTILSAVAGWQSFGFAWRIA